MDDIAPKLLELIQQSYQNGISESELLAEITKLTASGKATYLDADQYAAEIGRILAEAYQENLSSAMLPDGKMYYNIAKRVIEPTMQEGYSAAAGMAQQVQQILNQAAGIGIKAIRPTLDPDKIAGIINRLSNAEDYDEVSWVLGESVMKNFTQSVVTDSIRENAEYHGRAGLTPKVIRKSSGHCCDWCSKLAGTYTYPDVPRDVYRRHKNCTCTVEYIPGDGKKQNVWTKGWSEEVESDKIEARKAAVSDTKTVKANYARGSQLFFVDDDALITDISPLSVEKEMETSPIGRKVMQYIKESGVMPQFVYEKPQFYIRGAQRGRDIKIYMSNISSDREAAQTVVHEMTHYMYGIGGCQWAETQCFIAEKMHIIKRSLTTQEIKEIIQLVKKNYPEYHWKKGGFINGTRI